MRQEQAEGLAVLDLRVRLAQLVVQEELGQQELLERQVQVELLVVLAQSGPLEQQEGLGRLELQV